MILLLTIMGIAGAMYVSRGAPLTANYIWAVSNLGFICHNITIAEYEMASLFAVYEILALYGICNLRSKKRTPQPEAALCA